MDRKQKILAVDDEPRNLKILTLSLGDAWELKTASTGEEALQILETYTPDVILLDIMMPGIDGYEVCKRIRANPTLLFTKVILVSGKALLEERLKGYADGADDYITKPFISEELTAKVKVFMRLVLVERELKELTLSLDEKVQLRGQQLLEAEAKLVSTAKMSALGEMAGGIAHEINTPLATIVLVANQVQDLLGEESVDKPMALECMDIIEQTAGRIGQIVLGLRTFSRDGSLDSFEKKSVQEIVKNTVSLCKEKFKHGAIDFTIEPFSENLSIDCRPSQISQVLLNLLNNAFDAIAEFPQKWIRLSVEELENSVKIKVTDCGHGISQEVQDRLFQPFFTTKEVGKGTGLGLSISQGLIQAHHGTLSVDPHSPNTCFVIELPKEKPTEVGA